MSRQWIRQPERGTRLALRLIGWIALHLGRPPARLLLLPITLYFLIAAPQRRRASAAFLQLVLGRPPRIWHVARHIHTFAATILDRVYLVSGQQHRFDIRIHGGDVLLDKVRRGQGCILLGSHLGSFEVLRALTSGPAAVPLKVLMYPDHNQRITEFFASINPDIANTVIPLGRPDSMLAVHEALGRGAIVGMLGDRVSENDRVVRCRFLGSDTAFPAGAMLLASLLDVPVVLAFGLYRGKNRYSVHFEAFAEHVATDRCSRNADLCRWTQRYVDCLEKYARRAPYNWFNFYDYWSEDTYASRR